MTVVTLGKFIVVDGGEGSGKGTVLAALKEVLPPEKNVFTREPGGTPRAEEIRSVILGSEGASALTNFHLFCAARSDHLDHKIRPALSEGKNVICDRYDMSTFAYQIYGQQNHFLRGAFYNERELLGKLARPDLYIYLDVDVVEGLKRVRGRREENHLDRAPIEFHERVRQGYLEFLKTHPHRVIDANRTMEAVKAEFIEVVQSALA
jgi:dTMP kinase